MGPVGHMQFVPERPTGHYEQYQTARVIMGPVGCNGHEQGWGGGISSSSSSIYNRHSIHYSVVSCPLGLHAVGEKYIYALPFPTQSTPLHLHVQMVLEGNPGRERGSPVGCSFVPVGLVLTFEETDRFSDRARSVVVLLVLTFEETDRFSDRTGRLEHPPSLACTPNGPRGKSRSGKREPGRLFICTGRSCTDL